MAGEIKIESKQESRIMQVIIHSMKVAMHLGLEAGLDVEHIKKVFQIEEGRKSV